MNTKEALLKEMSRASEFLRIAQETEELTGEASDSMARRYWEGYTEALNIAVNRLAKESN